MELLTENDVLNHCAIFVNTTIINPSYNSQSKEKLTTKISSNLLNFGKKFNDSLKESMLFELLSDFYQIKYEAIKRAETKKLNATIKTTKSKKLLKCASKLKEKNQLWIFEGTSASNGFRASRNLYQSAYLLRGKITNTFNLDKNQILQNQELREVLAALGILFDEPKSNVKNCNYSKIIFATDMDVDGNHICGLLLAFFAKYFPELFRAGYIYRALSPIVIARKKSTPTKYYYNLEDYHKEEHKLNGWTIKYCKGLGALRDEDYKTMVRQQKLIKFTLNQTTDMNSIAIWFDKSTDHRKKLILEDSGVYED
jgi:DNA topoisomerase-2